MEQYNVTGMSCAACSARVEKAVNSVPGVTSCAVSLLTNSMGVEGTADPQAVISAVESAGYGAYIKGMESTDSVQSESFLEDKETPILKKRLVSSLVFLLILMYFSMGHTMFGFPLPSFFDGNHVAMGLVQLLLSAVVMVINQKFFISGFRSLMHKAPNMDTLVAMGSMTSFLWSVYTLFAMTKAQTDGNIQLVEDYMMNFYFESSAMILTLITVGKMFEAKSKGKTTDALKSLMKLAPKTASIIKDGQEVTLPVEQVKKGDIFTVRPGESIPVDGIVKEGESAVNESSLTGESVPIDKAVGDTVSSGTINQAGFIKCEAVRVGEDTALAKIIKMVSDASATKAPIAKIADKVSGIFVPAVIAIAVFTVIVWLIVGQTFGYALARGISVLVISCPCALGLATPVAIMVGNGIGAKNGILFKTAVSLEETGKIQIIALDKTGTVTKGEPVVTDVVPFGKFNEENLLEYAYSLEKMSEHPLAQAIIKYGDEKNVKAQNTTDFSAVAGNGLKAVINGRTVTGGSMKYISGLVNIPDDTLNKAMEFAEQGKTPLLFSADSEFIGIIAVADVIKQESPQAVRELQNMGIKVVMLTGDNEKTAKTVGEQAGVDQIIAGVLPEGKEKIIRMLKKQGKTAMVGDGINDSPALTRADIGIAIGAGTDIAIDSADIVLINSKLTDVSTAVRLSRETLKNIKQNLFWAFFYNVIGIPLAAGAYIKLFGWELNPMFGAMAMSLSSFFVVTNALRLNLFDVRSTKKDKPLKNSLDTVKISEEDKGESKTVKIKGMMCSHCENRVKTALEKLPQIDEAVTSYEKGTAVIVINSEISEKEIKKAVEEQGYKFVSVK